MASEMQQKEERIYPGEYEEKTSPYFTRSQMDQA